MEFKEFAKKCPWCYCDWKAHTKCQVGANGGPMCECTEENCGLFYANKDATPPRTSPVVYGPIKYNSNNRVDGDGNNLYKCPKCGGSDILSWFEFCPNCGVEISVQQEK